MRASNYQTRFSLNIKALLFRRKKENTNRHYLFFCCTSFAILSQRLPDLLLSDLVFSHY